MASKVLIGTARSGHVRVYIADTKELCESARVIHDLYPTSAAALGRTLSITAVMGTMLKGEKETVTTTINGGGPIGTIMAVAKNNGEVKGFCGDNEIYLKYNDSNKLAVGMAVGNNGYLSITKDLHLKEKYTSKVQLRTGEIGDDFAYYFAYSEQRNTITSLGVLVDTDYSIKSAGVLLIELLPNSTEEDIVYLEKIAKELKPISSVLEKNNNLKEYANSLFEDFIPLELKSLAYVCDCSKGRFLEGLLTLPKDELKDLIKEDEIKIKCEFCDKEYIFKKEDLEKYV